MTADAAGEGKLLEETPHALFVLTHLGIDLRVGTLEIHRPQYAGRAMAGAGEKDGIQVVTQDHAIQMRVHERKTGTGAPMTEQAVLDVFGFERFAQ